LLLFFIYEYLIYKQFQETHGQEYLDDALANQIEEKEELKISECSALFADSDSNEFNEFNESCSTGITLSESINNQTKSSSKNIAPHLPIPTILNLQFILQNAADISELKGLIVEHKETIEKLQQKLTTEREQNRQPQRDISGGHAKNDHRDTNNTKKRKRTQDICSDDGVERIVRKWNDLYICKDHVNSKCKYATKRCKHIHDLSTNGQIRDELKKILHARSFQKSSFLNALYENAKHNEMNCMRVIQEMRQQIERTLITRH